MGFIGKQPAKAAITSSDITDGVVTADKLASNAVTTAKISDTAVTTAKITDANVTTAKIAGDAVTDAKIADDVVGTEHLTAGEVDTTALGADAVTAAKVADDAISDEHLDVTAITGQTAETSVADDDTILIHDTSASALRKMTKTNFVGSVGGMTQLNETDISSSNGSSFRISVDTSTYNLLFISIGGVATVASTSGNMPDFKLGFNNDTTSGNYNFFRLNSDGDSGSTTFSQTVGETDGFYFNGSGFAGFEYLNAQAVWVYAPNKSDRYKLVSYTSFGQQDGQNSANYLKIMAGGNWKNNNAITECTFTAANTLTVGKITIFGMK